MRFRKYVMSVVGTLLLTVFAAQSVRADIIKDNLGGFSGAMAFDRIPGLYDGTKFSLGATFVGNGQSLGLVSFPLSFDDSFSNPNKIPTEGAFTIRLGFHTSVTGYAADPLCWAPEQPGYFHEVGTSAIVNSDWTTSIGTASYASEPGEVHNLYMLTLDLSDFDWMTTIGATQVLSISIDSTTGSPNGIGPFFAPTTWSNGPTDWWYSNNPFFGGLARPLPDFPMTNWGTNAAIQIQTVPSPASGCLMAAGATLLCNRRRRDCGCKPTKLISTTAIKIGPP